MTAHAASTNGLARFIETEFPSVSFLVRRLHEVADDTLRGVLDELSAQAGRAHQHLAELLTAWAGEHHASRPWLLLLEAEPFCWPAMQPFLGLGRRDDAEPPTIGHLRLARAVIDGCMRWVERARSFDRVALGPDYPSIEGAARRRRLLDDAEEVIHIASEHTSAAPLDRVAAALRYLAEALLCGFVLDGAREVPEELWSAPVESAHEPPRYFACTRPALFPPGSALYERSLDLMAMNISILAQGGVVHRVVVVRPDDIESRVAQRTLVNQLILMTTMRAFAPAGEVSVRLRLLDDGEDLPSFAVWVSADPAHHTTSSPEGIRIPGSHNGTVLHMVGHLPALLGDIEASGFDAARPLEDFVLAA